MQNAVTELPTQSRSYILALTAPIRSDRLLRACGAMGASEMCNRVTRVLTAVSLAHMLSPNEFGLAAVALTTWELMRVLTATGLDARILQCPSSELERVCRSSYSLNWLLYAIVFSLQIVAAVPISHAYGDPRIAWLVVGLAVPYLVFPWAAVQVCRLQREQRVGLTALMLTMLISGDNLLSALLAIFGCGLWSIVVPKIVVSFLWSAIYLQLNPWRPTGRHDAASLGSTFRFSAIILVTEIVNVLRLHVDKLIIGQYLGLEQLGIYYFAYNSGLGIMTGIVGAFSAALLPHFCNSTNEPWRPQHFWKPAAIVSLVTLPLIALQAGLAPVYVPLVFGERWQHAIPLMMVLCASGVTLGLWRALTQFVRSRGRPGFELAITAIYACGGIAAVIGAATYGLMAVAGAILATSLSIVPLLAFASLNYLRSTPMVARS